LRRVKQYQTIFNNTKFLSFLALLPSTGRCPEKDVLLEDLSGTVGNYASEQLEFSGGRWSFESSSRESRIISIQGHGRLSLRLLDIIFLCLALQGLW